MLLRFNSISETSCIFFQSKEDICLQHFCLCRTMGIFLPQPMLSVCSWFSCLPVLYCKLQATNSSLWTVLLGWMACFSWHTGTGLYLGDSLCWSLSIPLFIFSAGLMDFMFPAPRMSVSNVRTWQRQTDFSVSCIDRCHIGCHSEGLGKGILNLFLSMVIMI